MNPFNKLTNYIYGSEPEIHIYKNCLNVVNYIDIPDFNNNKITVRHKDGDIVITGSQLVVSKLLNDEILISGQIKNIELR